MKTIKNVIKNRTVSISRARTELDGQRDFLAETRPRVVSQGYQYQILTLDHDIGEFQ